jgi:hypothetical protein
MNGLCDFVDMGTLQRYLPARVPGVPGGLPFLKKLESFFLQDKTQFLNHFTP